MSGHKKKRRRSERPKHRPTPRSFPGVTRVGGAVPGVEKMSDVLMDFVAPYENDWSTADDLKKLLSVAAIAWNAAMLPAEKQDESLQKMLQNFPPEARPALKDMLDDLIRRKLALFADNRRSILDFQVTMTPTGPYVQVMSSFPTGEGGGQGGATERGG